MSKAKFKKALGLLYKQRFVEILEDRVVLTEAGVEELIMRKEGREWLML